MKEPTGCLTEADVDKLRKSPHTTVFYVTISDEIVRGNAMDFAFCSRLERYYLNYWWAYAYMLKLKGKVR